MADNGKLKTDEELQSNYRQVHRNGRIQQTHVYLAEQMWGGPLPEGYVVHHINGDPLDNRIDNLMILPSQAVHKKLHQFMWAKEASGHWNWRKCSYCKEYSHPSLIDERPGGSARHRECHKKYMKEYHAKRKLFSI